MGKCINFSKFDKRWSKWFCIRLEPQINWEVNNPENLDVISIYEEIASKAESSVADVIVLAGSYAVGEKIDRFHFWLVVEMLAKNKPMLNHSLF